MAKKSTERLEKLLEDIKRNRTTDTEYMKLSVTNQLLILIAEILLDVRDKK